MSDGTKDIYKPIPQARIDELTVIYDDYLLVTRLHEQLLHDAPLYDLAINQMEDMRLDSWAPKAMTVSEHQEFIKSINDCVYGKGNKAYVVLQHIKNEGI